jgi:predicted ATPase with chaperone activity
MFDLPTALSIRAANGQVPIEEIEGIRMMGELSLDGTICSISQEGTPLIILGKQLSWRPVKCYPALRANLGTPASLSHQWHFKVN